MSRPVLSVPNQWVPSGGAITFAMSV